MYRLLGALGGDHPAVVRLRRPPATGFHSIVLAMLVCSAGSLAALEQRLAGSQVLEGRHYVVESDATPVESAAMLAHLDRFHDHLVEVFAGIGRPAAAPEVVRYCHDRATFLAYGQEHCPGFSAGWYGYQTDGDAATPGELVLQHLGANRSVLQHEAFHRFMFRAYPGIRAWPRWFDEGLADWMARGRFTAGRFSVPDRLDPGDLERVRAALADGTLVPLERLTALDGKAWNGPGQALHYAEGYLLAAWLMRDDEPPVRGLMRSFLVRLAESQDYQGSFAATVAAVGLPRLQGAWVAWLRAWR
jgi:hypothetical protein